jgi:hypothetical protein
VGGRGVGVFVGVGFWCVFLTGFALFLLWDNGGWGWLGVVGVGLGVGLGVGELTGVLLVFMLGGAGCVVLRGLCVGAWAACSVGLPPGCGLSWGWCVSMPFLCVGVIGGLVVCRGLGWLWLV